MVAEPGAGAGGKRRSLRDKNDVVMIDGDTSGLVVTQINNHNKFPLAFYNFSFFIVQRLFSTKVKSRLAATLRQMF